LGCVAGGHGCVCVDVCGRCGEVRCVSWVRLVVVVEGKVYEE
jgi:hypothetical protein